MMKDNYLWDRSGEPDAEIQELEELLGSLRYKPQPLDIPIHIQPRRRQSFYPAMAIAAAIALFAVALGLWLSFNRHQAPVTTANNNFHIDEQVNAPAPTASPKNQSAIAQSQNEPKQVESKARRQTRAARTVIHQPKLTRDELAEKEQVLVALRLVSFKLNLAQRKTQAGPPLNSIRNQHRTG
jgi:ferric-dicitrate binding protein FerR (iron transport regulator)